MLSVFSITDNEKWDSIVRSFKDYDVYYLSGYVKAFMLHGDGEPLLFYYEDKNTRGINVVMKRDIAKDAYFSDVFEENTYFDFATPYGYGGWLIEGDGASEKLFSSYENWCKKNNVVSEFVRFHPVLDNHVYSTNNYEDITLGNTIALDTTSPEVIWANITSKNRNVIRKAMKNGVKIYRSRNPKIFSVFHKIYDGTMDKDNADQYYYFGDVFYQSILEDLPYNAEVFYAQLEDGTIIAASIMMMANGRMNYHLSGSLREYQHLAPTNLLLYEAALWACHNGCKTMHLGGGVGSGEDSLFKFKAAFNRKDVCSYHIGKKILDEEMYTKLVAIKEEKLGHAIEGGFFPKYRA